VVSQAGSRRNRITVTCGSTGKDDAAILATLVNRRSLFHDPYYENYASDAILSGCDAPPTCAHRTDNVHLRPEELRAALTGWGQAIICHEIGTTDRESHKDELEFIADLCKE
jgi:aminotransferase